MELATIIPGLTIASQGRGVASAVAATSNAGVLADGAKAVATSTPTAWIVMVMAFPIPIALTTSAGTTASGAQLNVAEILGHARFAKQDNVCVPDAGALIVAPSTPLFTTAMVMASRTAIASTTAQEDLASSAPGTCAGQTGRGGSVAPVPHAASR